jgi:hypothetical protein
MGLTDRSFWPSNWIPARKWPLKSESGSIMILSLAVVVVIINSSAAAAVEVVVDVCCCW